jgi:hypothetical protein
MAEKDLQTYVNKDLKKLGWGYYHREKGARHKSRSRNSFKYKEEKAAWPDLLIYPGDGTAFFVELKDTNGQPSEEQLTFIQWAKSMNYRCYVVRSVIDWEIVKKIEEDFKNE